MKKRVLAIMTVFLAATLLLAGCGSGGSGGSDTEPETFISSNDDNTVTINTNKTGAGSGGLAYITVGEGEVVIFEETLEKGSEIELKFFPSEGSGDTDEEMEKSMEEIMPEEDDDTIIVTVENGSGGFVELDPGEYVIGVNVTKESTGTVTLRTGSAS